MAVLSTPLASTAQRVLQLGCLVAGDSHLRSQRLAFVGKQAVESLNVFVRDLVPVVLDNRLLEMVADGLPLFHGAQLALDTTMVSLLKRGSACPRKVPLWTALPWRERGRGRKRRVENWQDDSVAPAWLSWFVKWEEGGQRSARIPFQAWLWRWSWPFGLQRSESPSRTTGGVGV